MFRFLDFREELAWRLGDRHLLRFGVKAGQTKADYDYDLQGAIFDPFAPLGEIDVSHAGTLTTPLDVGISSAPGDGQAAVIMMGPRNSEHLGTYQRLDLRANRDVQLRSAKLSYYLEVTNLLNHENPCCVEDWRLQGDGRNARLAFDESNWLPMIPSFGVQFEF